MTGCAEKRLDAHDAQRAARARSSRGRCGRGGAGLGTPGFLCPDYQYGVVMIAGGLTLPAGAAILALSTFELPPFLRGVKPFAIPVALDLARSAQARPLAGDLAGSDLVGSEEVFLGSHVRAITLRLAQKDEYTEQHTRRVALRAVQVGEALGVSRRRLRALAIGGLVHDIGKLSVPDAILKKPGPLDDEEYEVVKRHAELGAKLIDELGGFPDSVRRLVRDHHERLDGTGYPAGLRADELSLDARILSVCDVYDALISPRVYRVAWTHEQAMSLLRAGIGTAFDGCCVEALDTVLRAWAGTAASVPTPHTVPPALPATVNA